MWSLTSVLNKTVGLCLRADCICECVGTCCGCVTAGERALERTAERAAERVGERAFERTAERAAERALERTAGMPLGIGPACKCGCPASDWMQTHQIAHLFCTHEHVLAPAFGVSPVTCDANCGEF